MKIRTGVVLAMATLFGVTGCASGGGSAGDTGGTSLADLAAGTGQGERPRDTENTRTAERHMEAGDEAADDAEARMQYEQALTAAEAAIVEDGTNPLGYRLAAMAALGLDRYEEAGGYFDRAAELRPLYEFEDQPVRERTWIDLYQEAAPLVQSGEYEEAAEIFEDAHAIYQGRPEAIVTLSQLYAQLGQHERSLEFMDQAEAFMASDAAAAVDSTTAAGWQESVSGIPVMRAQVLGAAGRLEEAAVAFRALAEAEPDNVEHVRSLGATLMQMGDEAAALEVYQDLLSRPGLGSQDYYAIGVGFYQADDYGQAASAFQRAAEVSRNDRDAIEMWARSLQLDSAYAAIPPVAERWVELDPYNQNGYIILAQASNENGDVETTSSAMGTAQELEVTVDQLQLQRFTGGGGIVSGQVTNKTLEQGASVTMRFTFYGTDSNPIGSVTETVSLGAQNMAAVVQVQFDSAEEVGGYGYELTIG